MTFVWAGGLRRNVVFRTPGSLTLSQEEMPAEIDEVWYVDCCPVDLADPAAGRPFRVFDHHVSNARLHQDDSRCVFDMERSGTSLLFRLTGGLRERHHDTFIAAFEDYDLGRFDNPVGMRLADIASTFSQEQMLDELLRRSPLQVMEDRELSARASAAQAIRDIYCAQADRSKRVLEVTFPSCGRVTLGMATVPRDWKNECAQLILRDPEVDVAVVVDVMGSMISLRSRNGGPDCSLIAGLYGGGGHARAAGFSFRGGRLLSLIKQEVFE